MDYLLNILEDETKVREIISSVSSDFDGDTHDDLWLVLFKLHDVDTNYLVNSSLFTDLYRFSKLIHANVMVRAKRDAELDEDAAIEAAKAMRADQLSEHRQEWAA